MNQKPKNNDLAHLKSNVSNRNGAEVNLSKIVNHDQSSLLRLNPLRSTEEEI